MENLVLVGLLMTSIIGAGAVGTAMMAGEMRFMDDGHMGMMGGRGGHMMDEMHEHHGECEEMHEECEEVMDEDCDELTNEECLELHDGDHEDMSEFCNHEDHEHDEDAEGESEHDHENEEHGCSMMH